MRSRPPSFALAAFVGDLGVGAFGGSDAVVAAPGSLCRISAWLGGFSGSGRRVCCGSGGRRRDGDRRRYFSASLHAFAVSESESTISSARDEGSTSMCASRWPSEPSGVGTSIAERFCTWPGLAWAGLSTFAA